MYEEWGRCDPARLLVLVERLPDGCMTHALRQGEEHWRERLGCGLEYQVLAGVYDALNVNTAATGNWRRKPPEFEPWPTPAVLEAKRGRVSKPGGALALLEQMAAGE